MSSVTNLMSNGLTQPTAQELADEKQLFASAQPISTLWANKSDDSKVIDWNNEFDNYLKHRAKLIENEGIEKLLPFNLYKSLNVDWLDGYNYSQGNVGSCMGNGHKNAMKASSLVNQYFTKLVAPEICLSITYSYARGNGSLRWGSGANLSEMSKWSAKLGNYSAKQFGKYSDRGTNVRKPTEAEHKWALAHQSIIIPLKDNKFDTYYKLCAAGIGIAIGTRRYPGASKVNNDGLGVVSSWSRGNHATSIIGAITLNGNRYVYFENSHGNSRYKVGSLGHGSGCWVGEDDFSPISQDWDYFGRAYGVVMELPKVS